MWASWLLGVLYGAGMMTQVTVCTPTIPNRHEKLLRAHESVKAQTYESWLHLIVPDGPDPEIGQVIPFDEPKTTVFPLGRRHQSPGWWNRILGGLVADTPYIAYLDDDNTWRPNHLELLVGALEEDPAIGFAYGQMTFLGGVLGGGNLRPGAVVGQIDTTMIVHRVELLSEIATWLPPVTSPQNTQVDGWMVNRWLEAGVQYRFIPEVTVDYGGANYQVDGIG